jgi:hypothetical protein
MRMNTLSSVRKAVVKEVHVKSHKSGNFYRRLIARLATKLDQASIMPQPQAREKVHPETNIVWKKSTQTRSNAASHHLHGFLKNTYHGDLIPGVPVAAE